MSMRVLVVTGLSVCAAAIFACSGATPDSIDAPPGSSQFSSDPGDSGTSSSTQKDSGSGSQGNPTVDSGTQSFGTDSGTPQQVDSGTTSTNTATYCGSGTPSCNGTTPQCCAENPANTTDPFNLECIAQNATCNGVPIACRDKTSCKGANEVCCGERTPGVGYTALDCSSSCVAGSDITTSTQFRMCNPSAATDECTALGAGWQCTASTALPGFGYCDNGT